VNDTYVTVNTTVIVEITNNTNVSMSYTETTFEHSITTYLTVIAQNIEIDVNASVTVSISYLIFKVDSCNLFQLI
jgi:hypothetical protein